MMRRRKTVTAACAYPTSMTASVGCSALLWRSAGARGTRHRRGEQDLGRRGPRETAGGGEGSEGTGEGSRMSSGAECSA